jgi:hypothetical protein
MLRLDRRRPEKVIEQVRQSFHSIAEHIFASYSKGAQFRSFFVNSNFDDSIIVEIVDQNSRKLIFIVELSLYFMLMVSNLP